MCICLYLNVYGHQAIMEPTMLESVLYEGNQKHGCHLDRFIYLRLIQCDFQSVAESDLFQFNIFPDMQHFFRQGNPGLIHPVKNIIQ